ncbi:MAG TPA: type II toxin-antitoxin system prevent-host-death family antitoxin [Gammaproteobacteria bacterium]|nr:type II toxin-antitoxin system prevent-host-death family antitoxin [Gammaproteobacteria bacterium]
MDMYSVRDLRERTGELIRDAETGELSVVTKQGRPVFIAVPFDEKVLESGIPMARAIKLYQEKVLSMGKAAQFAGCPVAEFIQHLVKAGIPSVRYSSDELDAELAAIG